MQNMGRVSRAAVLVCFLVYGTMGAFGYFDFLSATKGTSRATPSLPTAKVYHAPLTPRRQPTPGNILQNYHLGGSSVKDIVTAFAFVAITVTVVMAFPLNIFPCRYTIQYMMYGDDHKKVSFSTRFFLTLALCGSALGVAICVPSINVVFQLLGGTSSGKTPRQTCRRTLMRAQPICESCFSCATRLTSLPVAHTQLSSALSCPLPSPSSSN